jgi:N-acetylglutamate synthase-like GNAT family acetyltransferase
MRPQIKDGYEISTDKNKLDIPFIHQYLSTASYWAKNIPLEIVKKSIDGSVCFGVYDLQPGFPAGKQVGFARMVTDCATFGYLADVFIIDQHRTKGLSKWLMEIIIHYPDFKNLRRWMLATKDAHGLYKQFGFTELDKPERIMQKIQADPYPLQEKPADTANK